MALKDIKAKIGATTRTGTVTRAMEAVSAVKMRKTQAAALAGRQYARAALSILMRLAGTHAFTEHPLARTSTTGRVAVVVITSDKGLAGSLNGGVIRATARTVADTPVEEVAVFAYGKKGEEYFARRGYAIVESFVNKGDDISPLVMEEFVQRLTQGFMAGAYRRVEVIYSNFKSTFEQEPTARTLLPLSLPAVETLVRDITPVKGKWSNDQEVVPPVAYRIEPSGEAVIEALLPRLVAVSLHHMLLESKASEHSARMVAMKNASDKSKEIVRDLTRTFNKMRQAAITREISEIVGGREALTV